MLLIALLSCVVIVICAPPEVDDDQSRLSVAVGIFAQRLYAQLPFDVAPFVLFSPYAVHSTLSMAYLGAAGDTAQEIKSVLLISTVSDPHEAHNKLLKNLKSQNKTSMGLSLWFDSDKRVNSSYQNDAIRLYNADVNSLEFDNPRGPEAPINDWVSRKTNENVQKVIRPEEVKKGKSDLILVGTFNINGRWKKEFSEENNFIGLFYMEDGTSDEVIFMTQSGEFQYKKSALGPSDLLRLELDDNEHSLYLLLPQSDTNTFVSELNITDTDVDELATNTEKTRLTVTIPRLKISTTMKLKRFLSEMGMTSAFNDSARFPGISDTDIKISEVVQRTNIEIKEAGLTSASSTADRTDIMSYPVEFKANRPFLFGFRNDRTKTFLFAGIINDPRATEIEIS